MRAFLCSSSSSRENERNERHGKNYREANTKRNKEKRGRRKGAVFERRAQRGTTEIEERVSAVTTSRDFYCRRRRRLPEKESSQATRGEEQKRWRKSGGEEARWLLAVKTSQLFRARSIVFPRRNAPPCATGPIKPRILLHLSFHGTKDRNGLASIS